MNWKRAVLGLLYLVVVAAVIVAIIFSVNISNGVTITEVISNGGEKVKKIEAQIYLDKDASEHELSMELKEVHDLAIKKLADGKIPSDEEHWIQFGNTENFRKAILDASEQKITFYCFGVYYVGSAETDEIYSMDNDILLEIDVIFK